MTTAVVAIEAPASAARRPYIRWRSPTVVLGITGMVLLIALTAFGPMIWGQSAEYTDLMAINQGPSLSHVFGTDGLGRDILARTLVAAQLSVGLSMEAIGMAAAAGVLIGGLSAVIGGRLRALVDAAIHIAIAFPPLLLALFVASIFGIGNSGAVYAIAIAVAPSIARFTQTLAREVAEKEFVQAATLLRIGRFRMIVRHILPNIGPPLIVKIAMLASGILLAFSSLSFLALGVQPPSYDWGRLMNDGLTNIYSNPAAALAPGLFLVAASLALNLMGEALAQVLIGGGRVSIRRQKGRSTFSTKVEPQQSAAAYGAAVAVRNLRISAGGRGAELPLIRGVDLNIRAGESVGIVGESGSGKSLTALAIAGLLRPPLRVDAIRLNVLGVDLTDDDEERIRRGLGTSVAMVFQDPLSSLNPTMRVGAQLAEVARKHQHVSRAEALRLAVASLKSVRVTDASRRAQQYPHEFSGGMRQRAMIGMGLMGSPRLLIADEPTTALDVTVQRSVLQLIIEAGQKTDAAMILISHDLAVVSQVCDRIVVMYAGRIVEDGSVEDIIQRPAHPYTKALLDTTPKLDADRSKPLKTIPGRPPQPHEVGVGCPFANRCQFATAICREREPHLEIFEPGRSVACWHPIGTQPVSTEAKDAYGYIDIS